MKNKNHHAENHDIMPQITTSEESSESRLPKAYMDTGLSDEDDEKPAKLPKIEAQDRLEAEQEQQYQIEKSLQPSIPAPEIPKPPTINPEVQAAILAAKAKIESQIPPLIENIGESISIDFTKFLKKDRECKIGCGVYFLPLSAVWKNKIRNSLSPKKYFVKSTLW